MRASVIMVNLDGEPFIIQALESLSEQSFRDFEVIVVDNGSRDRSLEKVRGMFSAVRIIELGKNMGFAYACNEGFRQSKGEDIAVINNDAFAEPDWLKEMLLMMDSDERIGMVASRVIGKKTGQIESAGIFPARNGLVYLKKPKGDEPEEVFGACGVAGLYRGKMLREIGFYELDFFIYYEDADIAYRAQRAGFKAVYCPKAVVYHLGSETTSGMNIKDYYLPRNKLRTIIRNWDLRLILKGALWIIFYECASLFGAILRGNFQAIRARLDFLRLIKKDLKARKSIFSKTASEFKLDKWISKNYPGIIELWRRR